MGALFGASKDPTCPVTDKGNLPGGVNPQPLWLSVGSGGVVASSKWYSKKERQAPGGGGQ